MDLRKYPKVKTIDEKELLNLWWYQPYIFTDDIISGIAPTWFIKGLDKSIIKRSKFPRQFRRFWNLSNRTACMYQDWLNALCNISLVNLKQARVFEIACNTGYCLFWLKERGARCCVGIDKAELDKQQSILREITGINDIDFRKGGWFSEMHYIDGLCEDERFDIVICTAFAQHISDPLHLIKQLSDITENALLFHSAVGCINLGMNIRCIPAEHHKKWGDKFPNNFDTVISRKLLIHSLKECGFRHIVELRYRQTWLPWWWYKRMVTLVCVK